MHSLRAVLLATLTLVGFAVAVPTAAAPTDPAETMPPSSLQNEQTASTQNGSLGAEISSFMQVSTAQTEGTVDSGLWVARYNGTNSKSARKKLVEKRVGDIQTRMDDLRERKQSLVEARKNGEISTLRYQAEMSEVIGQIRSLEHAINTTKPRAMETGTSVEDLRELDKQASNVGGPEVAEVARSLQSVKAPGRDNSTQTPGVGNGNGGGTENGNSGGVSGVGNNSSVDNGNGNGNGDGVDDALGTGNNSTVGVGAGDGSSTDRGNERDSLENGTGNNGTDGTLPSVGDASISLLVGTGLIV
ncbi:hypothetical protein [Haladaptatus sp. NG-WS-4]